ncbi:hypothetical protein [Pseudoclavibacter helvolus]|uniref:hypothetical protein n=1 Tax=Pseudoclavibacter helvolus TaxID=255205 RepID=UPI000837EE27|nr:hypothetical protein [Pseudoclavibacter helvolus]
MSEFRSLIDSAELLGGELETSASPKSMISPTLVYWKDETGEHSLAMENTSYPDECDVESAAGFGDQIGDQKPS